MGTKRKRKLKEDAVPTKFSFSNPVKRRQTTEQRVQIRDRKNLATQLLSEASCSSTSNSSLVVDEVEVSNEAVPAVKKDAAVQTKVNTKSKSTQYNGVKCIKKPDLINVPKRTPIMHFSKGCNTDISFKPFDHVNMYVSNDANFQSTPVKGDYSDCSFDTPGIDAESNDHVYSNDSQTSDKDSDDNSFDDANEESLFITTNAEKNYVAEPKFLVFWSCLFPLFELCSKCFQKNSVTNVHFKGTLLTVKTLCKNRHAWEWRSQPRLNGTGVGNILLSAAILYSGNTFGRITELLQMINVVHFSRTYFFTIQKSVLFPTVNKFYKSVRQTLYDQYTTLPTNDFTGDGRSDSPGYSAKYGTYSLMHTGSNKVVDFQVVHVLTAGNSSLMEKVGLQTLLEKFRKIPIPISTLTTDRHTQIRAFLRKHYPSISHQFDVWHFAKSVKKKLCKLAKKSCNKDLNNWIKSIVNHLWWCSKSCDGNGEILIEKWQSILFHVRGIHSWKGCQFFKECSHGKLDKKRKWLKKGSPAFSALKSVIEDKRTVGDLKYLVEFRHTGNLEVYHSVVNKYCPKRLHFSMHGMIARTQLAVLDFNSGSENEQQMRKDGALCYKLVFSRVTQSWVTKKVMKKKQREYLYSLLLSTIDSELEGKDLPAIGDIPDNIASKEKPDKSEAILNMRTRFSTE